MAEGLRVIPASLGVFADDVGVAMHELLHALPPVIHVLRLMRTAPGLARSTTEILAVKWSAQGNFAVKRSLTDTLGLGGAVVARVGTYLEYTLGPEAKTTCGLLRWHTFGPRPSSRAPTGASLQPSRRRRRPFSWRR